jgi:hypothetical protein
MNDAVQVKGLFINPPGNIWTGFNTTFEGENRPFQQMLIPFYVNQNTVNPEQEARAEIFDAEGKRIQTVSAQELSPGLNYLTWKLDEATSRLPGAYVSDESRGIPVLPGTYSIVVHFEGEQDTTEVQVIPDPRFEPMPEVDAAHYTLRKRLDKSVAGLSKALNRLSASQETLENIQQQLDKMDYGADHPLREASREIEARLKALNDQARGKRPEKQVGAWQSFETTAYGQVSGTLWRLQGRTFEPSSQDEAEVTKAEKLVHSFEQSVEGFYDTDWKSYRKQVEEAELSWFGEE